MQTERRAERSNWVRGVMESFWSSWRKRGEVPRSVTRWEERRERKARGGVEGGAVVEDGAGAGDEGLDAYEVHYPAGLGVLGVRCVFG